MRISWVRFVNRPSRSSFSSASFFSWAWRRRCRMKCRSSRMRGFPVALEAREPVVEPQALRIGVLRDGELQREHVHAAGDPNHGRLRYVLVNQVVASFGGIVDDGLVQHRQARQRDLGHPVAAAVHQERRKTGKAAVAAEIEPSGRRLEGASGAEFIPLQAIIGLEDGDLAGSRREPVQAAGRGYPHVAAVCAQDAADDVVGEAVLLGVPTDFARCFIPLEEALFRAEPDGAVRAAADVVDAGRDAVADGRAERHDPVQRRVVAEGTVITAHPKAPGLV